MKTKYQISIERIQQITNDIAEGNCYAENYELVECVKYWADQRANIGIAFMQSATRLIADAHNALSQ